MNSKDEYEDIYAWVDQIPLSRRKKNISRDFSDAVLLAEILKQFFPTIVDLHNYSSVSSKCAKISNWETLNRKVLRKLDITVSKEMIVDLASSNPGAIEQLLSIIRASIESGIKRSQNTLDSNAENAATALTHDNMLKMKEELDKCRGELKEKDDTISNLKNEINHLHTLIKLKEERIADLNLQIKNQQEIDNTFKYFRSQIQQ